MPSGSRVRGWQQVARRPEKFVRVHRLQMWYCMPSDWLPCMKHAAQHF